MKEKNKMLNKIKKLGGAKIQLLSSSLSRGSEKPPAFPSSLELCLVVLTFEIETTMASTSSFLVSFSSTPSIPQRNHDVCCEVKLFEVIF